MNTKTYQRKVKQIKDNHTKNLKWLSKHKFGSRRHLLWVTKQAYRHVLDNMVDNPKNKRLTENEEFELGRNLAKYWFIKK